MCARLLGRMVVLASLLFVVAAQAAGADDAPSAAPPSDVCDGGSSPTLPQVTECLAQARNALTTTTAEASELTAKKNAADQVVADKQKGLQAAKEALATAGAKDKATAGITVTQAESALESATSLLTTTAEQLKNANEKKTRAETELDRLQTLSKNVEKSVDPSAVAAVNKCAEPLMLCLRSNGSVLDDKALPTEVYSGDILSVKIFITIKQQRDNVSVAVTSSQRKPVDTLFDKTTLQPRANSDQPANDDALVLFNVFTLPAIADDTNELAIQVSETKADKTTSAKLLRININRGHSYYSIAFLVAATYRGERTIYRDLTAKNDLSLEAGFALNVFPGGRRRGVIGYLGSCDHLSRCVADTFGLQFGTDLDLSTPFDRVFAGVVFEPVVGLALSTGLSIRQVSFVPHDSEHPGLVNSTMNAPSELQRVVRPYIGITITFDLLDTIAKVKAPTRPGG